MKKYRIICDDMGKYVFQELDKNYCWFTLYSDYDLQKVEGWVRWYCEIAKRKRGIIKEWEE